MKKKESRIDRPSRRLQQLQLSTHIASRNPVVVHLASGIRLHGVIVASDSYMVLLAETPQDPLPQVIYKHAIAVITPAHAPEAIASVPGAESSPDFVSLYTPRTRKRR
ncbi:RNA chaperone Hfq [Cupriavidus basilensis]|uniref:RNA chaperone Hfq n=1 Tax=Cupriavidus basilensis TaxID=68895 RepID=A0ABT6B280_9BURK|nr:RNA chaperone Hfq [Cupriavidus basilensis]MDF3838994.1 RNA chaperone Hfq [Cupriavidus basilensis]